jgi:hypothetical protein
MVTQIEIPNLTQKELILALIKADMRNVKLIQGLDRAGALVEHFYSDLSVVILKLIGFKETERTDALYELYDKKMNMLIDVSVHEFREQLNYLAVDFYNELLLQKMMLNKINWKFKLSEDE